MSAKLRWYIVQASFGFEILAIENLKSRISDSEYGELFGEISSPSESVDKAVKKKNNDLFPGYVLVQMVMNDETWHLVKETPKVISFLGATMSMPVPISSIEAKKILGHNTDEKSLENLAIEDKIIVTEGPFKDYSGTIKSISDANKSAEVMIMIFDRETPAKIPMCNLKKSS
jgi:transcriptional antiterminator NusG